MKYQTEADRAIEILANLEIDLAPRIQPWSLQQAVRTNLLSARALIKEWKERE